MDVEEVDDDNDEDDEVVLLVLLVVVGGMKSVARESSITLPELPKYF